MSVLPLDPRLEGISPKSYEHPADRAASAALKSVPMLDTVEQLGAQVSDRLRKS